MCKDCKGKKSLCWSSSWRSMMLHYRRTSRDYSSNNSQKMKLVVLFQIQKGEMRCQKYCNLQRKKNSFQFQICKLRTPSKSQKANTGHYKNSPIFFNHSLNSVCTIFDEPFITFLGNNKTTFPNQINTKKQQKKWKTRQHFLYIEERENRITRVMCSEQRIAVWGGKK